MEMDDRKMKILSASVLNFGSYNNLHLTFNDKGLTLISGPTGAGKSTLCDIVPWILFGRTAKGGAVDEVRSWESKEATSGVAMITSNGVSIEVHRSRNPNDLYYLVNSGAIIRGKDINDTQNFLNRAIGMDIDTYLSGAYINEFNQSTAFFTANAKTRRALMEQIVDLKLATYINDSSILYKKELKAEASQIDKWLTSAEAKKEQLSNILEVDNNRCAEWNKKQKSKILEAQKELGSANKKEDAQLKQQLDIISSSISDLSLDVKDDSYFQTQLEEISSSLFACTDDKCPTCGHVKSNTAKLLLIRQENDIEKQQQRNLQTLARIEEFKRQATSIHEKKTSIDYLPYYKQRLEFLKNEQNPYLATVEENTTGIKILASELESIQRKAFEVKEELADVVLLLEVVSEFRMRLIKNTIYQVEFMTNKALNDHFDAELRVKFVVEDLDKLNIEITKDGHTSTFSQLSKGQRQLLKLCFSVAIMKATANHKGVSFNSIFLDEALDGLDAELKVKTYGLLQQLATEHDSVFVVEHSSDLKDLFPNKIEVSLVNGESQIEKM